MAVTTNIICNNQAIAESVADNVRCVDLFRGARVETVFKTYPTEADQHRTVRVTGTIKAVHAARAMAWTLCTAKRLD